MCFNSAIFLLNTIIYIFIEMGTTEEKARIALSQCGWEVNRAVTQLFEE
jgi:hypothetical protein